jgi:hypothetical protein
MGIFFYFSQILEPQLHHQEQHRGVDGGGNAGRWKVTWTTQSDGTNPYTHTLCRLLLLVHFLHSIKK